MKCQILFSGLGDNVHEMSNPIFWEKNKKMSSEILPHIV